MPGSIEYTNVPQPSIPPRPNANDILVRTRARALRESRAPPIQIDMSNHQQTKIAYNQITDVKAGGYLVVSKEAQRGFFEDLQRETLWGLS